MINLDHKKILISRTDSIGDVMLTLPICAWLKERFKGLEIHFLGSSYTKDIINAYDIIDQFHDWTAISKLSFEEQINSIKSNEFDAIIHVFPRKQIARLTKRSKIPVRVGTSHRLFHLTTCNYRVNFTRKRSDLHESQLNHELLRPFGLVDIPTLEDVIKTTSHFNPDEVDIPPEFKGSILLHPKSQGSAKEWPVAKYMELAVELSKEGKKVVFTGTENEGIQFRNEIPQNDLIKDSTGQLSLQQLLSLIKQSEALVACSTGPLHIAGYCGIKTIGLFSSRRPIHPGRWKALGENVVIIQKENCSTCANGEDCNCILEITVEEVFEKLK